MTRRDTSNKPSGEKPASPSPTEPIRHTFSKNERLCAKRSFGILFKKRRAFNAGRFWVVYTRKLPAELITAPAMVAFTVPKSNFKRANKRNLLKRRMREAYRLNKNPLLRTCQQKGKNVAFLIKYNTKEICSFREIEKDMRRVLRRLSEQI